MRSLGRAKEDTETLLKHVEAGGHIFISADYFYGSFADTLGLETSDSFFEGESSFTQNDTANLHFVSPVMDSTNRFPYKRNNIHNFSTGWIRYTLRLLLKMISISLFLFGSQKEREALF
ncbi:MAG: hypothetical protein U5K54_15715 [Cytophagales bacterium]|nr:hypothetical protein [Cytophagales bacterium]